MRVIEGVVFDKDGVLVDFERTWTPVIRSAALHFSGGDERKALKMLRDVGYDETSGTFLPGSVWAAGTNADLMDVWGADAGPQEREEMIGMMERFCEAVSPVAVLPPSRLRRCIGRLRELGLRLAVVSNDTSRSVRRMARAFGLEEAFDFLCGYDDVARPKPHPDPVLAFSRSAGIPAEHIAVIGDNLHDARMARAAGCGLFIGVLSGTSGKADLEPLSDFVVADVAQAVEIIESFSRGSIDARLARL